MSKPNVYVIIPARLESKRFPGKLLKNETGKTLLQHTVENALQVVDEIYVATSDRDIDAEAYRINKKQQQPNRRNYKKVHHVLTHECDNGTERAALAVMALRKDGVAIKDEDIIVVLQADEPEISVNDLERFMSHVPCYDTHVYTMASKVPVVQTDPNEVKVVVDRDNWANYFTREPLPRSMVHVGIYSAMAKSLLAYYQMPSCETERAESLEQLRWLYNTWCIKVEVTEGEPHSINTEEDYKAFVERWKAKQETKEKEGIK